VRSGPGAARTILLFHIISARASKQPLMVRTFLKVCMELGSYLLFLQEQIKDTIIIRLCNYCDQQVLSYEVNILPHCPILTDSSERDNVVYW
jgi:hypothetical protein